jgi:hypothetical protein
MWAKGAAVGNAGRCPRACPVRRQAHRPYVHSLPGAKHPAPLDVASRRAVKTTPLQVRLRSPIGRGLAS